MSVDPSKRGCIREAIENGIAIRGFYIVSTPDEIPGCRGNKSAKAECVQQFARDNGWRVTVHTGNGWLLFSIEHFPAPQTLENDLRHRTELIQTSHDGDHWLGECLY
jgi:hypothetical protein